MIYDSICFCGLKYCPDYDTVYLYDNNIQKYHTMILYHIMITIYQTSLYVFSALLK